MDKLPPAPGGIPPDELATWPLMARVLITTQQQIGILTAQVAALTVRVQELEQRLNQT